MPCFFRFFPCLCVVALYRFTWIRCPEQRGMGTCRSISSRFLTQFRSCSADIVVSWSVSKDLCPFPILTAKLTARRLNAVSASPDTGFKTKGKSTDSLRCSFIEKPSLTAALILWYINASLIKYPDSATDQCCYFKVNQSYPTLGDFMDWFSRFLRLIWYAVLR